MTETMRSSRLVQRLHPPHEFKFGGMKDNPFSFGGGLVNGGLSPDAMDLLRPIFSFDYMGAAEFEWGAVPEALQKLAKAQDQLRAWTLTVDLSSVPAGDWRDRDAVGDGVALIYVMGPGDWREEINSRITEWSRNEFPPLLKEALQLVQALRPSSDPERAEIWRTCGWLELDNGFMFFTDHDMWTNVCGLFGVEELLK